ncbi:hypothetical protein HAX54_008529 [Datura stramonium]|uniref:Uncharacterized protein n=1 Tax=Datura stramonium TaxID=4076 RepID=A0ABS8TDD5_DATST|nr:hypothetical protein [Datura stramonium]
MTKRILTDVRTCERDKVTHRFSEDIDEVIILFMIILMKFTQSPDNLDDRIPNLQDTLLRGRRILRRGGPFYLWSNSACNHTPNPVTPIENPTLLPAILLDQEICKDETDYDSEEEPKNTIDDAHAMQLLQTFWCYYFDIVDLCEVEVTDDVSLSPRGASHFSLRPDLGPHPPDRLKVKLATLMISLLIWEC